MELPVNPSAIIELLRSWFFAKDRSIIMASNTFLRLQHTDGVVFATLEVDAEHNLTITPSSDGGIRFQPTIDSIDFFQVLDADGGTAILNIDSTNERTGINTETPDRKLDILDTSSPQLRLTHTDNTKYTEFQVDTNHDLTITPSSTGQVILQPSSDSTDFFQVLDADGGTPVLNVDSTNERLGVGTASPSDLVTASGSIQNIRLVSTANGRTDANAAHAFTFQCASANSTSAKGLGSIKWSSTDPSFVTTNPKHVAFIGAYGGETYAADNDGASILVFGTAPANPGTGDNVAVENMRLDIDGNLGLGSTTSPTANAGKVMFFGDNTADPTMGANTAGVYGKDVAGTVELFGVDEAGNATQLTSHNFTLFNPDQSYEYPFSFSAKNHFIGKEIGVDMFGAIRALEQLTGQFFIYLRDLPADEILDWDEVEEEKKEKAEKQGIDYKKKKKPDWLKRLLDKI